VPSDNRDQLLAQARSLLEAAPELKFVDAFVADLNGVLRGKRLRGKSALKLFNAGLHLPRSSIWNDIWGADILEDSLVLDTGDRDGLCMPVETGLQPVPWAREPSAQILMMMEEPDGSPFSGDPRQLLVQIAGRCSALGLFPVAAIELEFVLLAEKLDDMGRPVLPPSTGRARRLHDGRTYTIGELDAYGAFFGDLYDACDQQGLPLDSALAETGPAQFEVNLSHQDDVVRAADHAILLRRAIKGVAARHGLLASFMAKPFTELPGNGLHVHMSVLDEQRRNIFDDGSPTGSDLLRSAVAGLVATAPEAMIFFAPHLNSMRRYQASSHAPTRVSWGYDNRTAAIRIPSARGRNRRFENRIPGADANPYLVLAAILGGVLHGIDHRLVPPAPVEGNAYAEAGPDLPTDWSEALDGFTNGDVLAPMFGPLLTRIFAACKRQEMRVAAARITDFEYDSYLQAF
jgi:glutamine synthetase